MAELVPVGSSKLSSYLVEKLKEKDELTSQVSDIYKVYENNDIFFKKKVIKSI